MMENRDPQNGDLLFLHLEGELADAIADVTKRQFRVNGPDLSHVGMVWEEEGKRVVYESWEEVRRTSFNDFLKRAREGSHWHLARWKKPNSEKMERAVAFMRRSMGKKYNATYSQEPQSFYCAELMAQAFREAYDGEDVFPFRPMFYGNQDDKNDSSWTIWKTYFGQKGRDVPVGQMGVNPLGIYLSSHLIQVK